MHIVIMYMYIIIIIMLLSFILYHSTITRKVLVQVSHSLVIFHTSSSSGRDSCKALFILIYFFYIYIYSGSYIHLDMYGGNCFK